MKKALVVGINHYPRANDLYGCVNDAKRVSQLLKRNGDGSLNFDVKEMYGEDRAPNVTKNDLKYEVRQLFSSNCEVALFYFAGHGYADENGGMLLTSECETSDDGLEFNVISNAIRNSKAQNNIVILDCCQAGAMGESGMFGDDSIIPPNTTFLLACKANQYSEENNGNGVFTDLFVDAISGGGANLVGEISPGSIYSYIDRALGLWQQRPVFKTNVERFVSIRNVRAPIALEDLRRITEFFPNINYDFPLDSSYESTSSNVNSDNARIFSILQKYNRLNLVVPVGEEHMYYAAMNQKSCRLTPLGVHYWNLVDKERI